MPPRAGLNKTKIVRAAVDLVNSEGPDALSLNRLARDLGVRTPSLYNHIGSLSDLYQELALLSTHQLGERLGRSVIGKSGPRAVMDLAQTYRDYVKENPGLYMLSLRSALLQNSVDAELEAAQAQVVEIGLAVVASFGLSEQDALHAVRGLRSLVHGFATLEVAGGFGLPLDCDESFRRLVSMIVRGLQKTEEILEEH